jgi:hypothetical protein
MEKNEQNNKNFFKTTKTWTKQQKLGQNNKNLDKTTKTFTKQV